MEGWRHRWRAGDTERVSNSPGVTQPAHGRAGVQRQLPGPGMNPLISAGLGPQLQLLCPDCPWPPRTWGLSTGRSLCQESSPFTGSFLVSFTSLFQCHLLFNFPPNLFPARLPLSILTPWLCFSPSTDPFLTTPCFTCSSCSSSVPPTRMQAPRGQGSRVCPLSYHQPNKRQNTVPGRQQACKAQGQLRTRVNTCVWPRFWAPGSRRGPSLARVSGGCLG